MKSRSIATRRCAPSTRWTTRSGLEWSARTRSRDTVRHAHSPCPCRHQPRRQPGRDEHRHGLHRDGGGAHRVQRLASVQCRRPDRDRLHSRRTHVGHDAGRRAPCRHGRRQPRRDARRDRAQRVQQLRTRAAGRRRRSHVHQQPLHLPLLHDQRDRRVPKSRESMGVEQQQRRVGRVRAHRPHPLDGRQPQRGRPQLRVRRPAVRRASATAAATTRHRRTAAATTTRLAITTSCSARSCASTGTATSRPATPSPDRARDAAT